MELKKFQVRLPRDLWMFAKKNAVDRDMSLNELINFLLEKYRKKIEKKLDEEN